MRGILPDHLDSMLINKTVGLLGSICVDFQLIGIEKQIARGKSIQLSFAILRTIDCHFNPCKRIAGAFAEIMEREVIR